MRDAYRIAEIARPNGPISRATLYREIAAGRLPARKLGRATILLHEDYANFLKATPRLKTPSQPA
ncbi:hypothetical protein GOFOIKOB_4885 [Methylobacterium tardum]|uniref:Helix-turn-helix domain-containing protein n=1 Tax=Methylobacterium tardum TaxID=374432 RepID=A0AA37TJA7_9HYPH|nr:helix-turn-helix domain-containing protein [Methylobacterium tardum]URD35816.1 helix-turn-helix domain-containing protein [Methylobacterium tardum]GJE51821.1 hypothetical protein GOFOIKOB_4885 [Methylobacterium tardum]GLS72323.1 hypothetical protein GCM10007890_43360 [Methylobacterium tardum]